MVAVRSSVKRVGTRLLRSADARTFSLRLGQLPRRRSGLVRLGSDYGGWWIPRSALRPGNVAYCAGAGEDISFDLALLEHDLRVRTFDPTPRSIDYVSALEIGDPDFSFRPVGIWSETTTIEMFAPADPTHVSHSIVNLQRTQESFEAPVERLDGLMHAFGDTSIDLLKLDIEGAEFAVLGQMLDSSIRPSTLCVELDPPVATRRARTLVRSLNAAGYELRAVERFNTLFVRPEPA